MSASTVSCLPSDKANEAVKHVIGTVLDFAPVDDCPLWLALKHDVTDESRVNDKTTTTSLVYRKCLQKPVDMVSFLSGLVVAVAICY